MPNVAMRFTSDCTISEGPMGATCVSPRDMGAGLAQPAKTSIVASPENKGAVMARDTCMGSPLAIAAFTAFDTCAAQRSGSGCVGGVFTKSLECSTR